MPFKISPIFLTNKLSATLIIPIEIARRHGLDKPAHVIIQETDNGIVIKKLSLDNYQVDESGSDSQPSHVSTNEVHNSAKEEHSF